MAVFATRALSAGLDGLQHLPHFPQREGVWEGYREELRAALRERLGREARHSASVIDSQSLKSAEKGDLTDFRSLSFPGLCPAAAASSARLVVEQNAVDHGMNGSSFGLAGGFAPASVRDYCSGAHSLRMFRAR